MARYRPPQKIPAYSYVPGKFPHPHRDPAGHSHGFEQEHVDPPSVEQWRECSSYLWGIDLFNAGFYWEAHEAWEQVWIAVARQGTIADFLKALIKLAAAGVKARENRSYGVIRHANRCLELLSYLGNLTDAEFLGLHVPTLQSAARLLADDADAITQRSVDDNQIHTLPIELILRLPSTQP